MFKQIEIIKHFAKSFRLPEKVFAMPFYLHGKCFQAASVGWATLLPTRFCSNFSTAVGWASLPTNNAKCVAFNLSGSLKGFLPLRWVENPPYGVSAHHFVRSAWARMPTLQPNRRFRWVEKPPYHDTTSLQFSNTYADLLI
ncbi:MAG: hypothetical protein IKX14_07770 [Neisseriaceae bacterium]|nr:hypothetical protein [Neisseriaceae bacterium]